MSAGSAFASTCPNEALRRGPSAGLPDCRAYELVSSEKDDADAMLSPLVTAFHSSFPNYGLVTSAGVLWETGLAWPYGRPSNGVDDVHQARRGSEACSTSPVTCWSQSTLAPPGVGGRESFGLIGASSDLSTVLLKTAPITFEPIREVHLLDRAPDGSYVAIAGFPKPTNVVARPSADGSHVFLQTEARLLGEDTHGPLSPETDQPLSQQVYEWTRSGGLRLAGVDSQGNQTSPCGAALPAGNASIYYPESSLDGSRLFFQSPDPELSREVPEQCRRGPLVEGSRRYVSDLYLRENGGRTVEISQPPPGADDYGAVFIGASSDGSKAFFVTETALTADKATSGPGHADLYEYDVQTGVLTRLSVGPTGYDDANVTAIGDSLSSSAIVSSDGSHVYFTARGQLVPGLGETAAENIGHDTANLYLYAHGRVSFIANVARGNFSGTSNSFSPSATGPLSIRVAAVTPDGSDLVFESTSRLTSYDNEVAGSEPEPVAELFRYDEASGTIACLSCSPAGLPPTRVSEHGIALHTSFWSAPQGAVQQFGGLSDDGSTVFFASTDRLLLAASNATGPVPSNPIYDVYEWHDGTLSLISSGTSPSSDFLVGSSPSASDVYFLTADQLAAQDGDHAYDIYDARVEGGIPPSVAPARCATVETCRSMPATPPVPVTPASVAVADAGNVAPQVIVPAAPHSSKPANRRTCVLTAKARKRGPKRRVGRLCSKRRRPRRQRPKRPR